jgi:16S rRNA (adenine1518-N6/adenine1519-N6)-dimethyltransferase
MLPAARKRFGQHFLTDRHYVRRIVEAIAPHAGESMVEIGPGTGILTEPLLEAGVRPLHAVEIDRDLARGLRERFEAQGLIVHETDVLEFDLATLPAPLRVVGNLPYNVSTPILFQVAANAGRISDSVFMLQKEVVDRMVAEAASPEYGRLSVMLQYRFEMTSLFRVPPGAFTPPPKVESAVVHMRPLGADRLRARDEGLFAQLVAAAFSQRRKTLRNATRTLAQAEAFERAGLDHGRRGETLSVAEFVRLADAVATQN